MWFRDKRGDMWIRVQEGVTTAPIFRRTRAEKNEILEQMKHYATLKANEEWMAALDSFCALLIGYYPRRTDLTLLVSHGMHLFGPAVSKVSYLYKRLFRASYILSKSAEVEALARQGTKPFHLKSGRHKLDQIGKKSFLGGSTQERLEALAFQQVTNLLQAYQRSIIQEDTTADLKVRLSRALPQTATIRKRRILRALTESDKKPENLLDSAIDVDTLPDDEWEEMKSFYQEVQTGYRDDPRLRNDLDAAEFADLEREATEEFVSQVRDGEVDAARENGIDDFVWIAIIDKATCEECCEKRDGLTTSEIESKLKDEWSDDDCDASVPPAHPNCRCTLGPIDTQKADEARGTNDQDYKSVEEWLNS